MTEKPNETVNRLVGERDRANARADAAEQAVTDLKAQLAGVREAAVTTAAALNKVGEKLHARGALLREMLAEFKEDSFAGVPCRVASVRADTYERWTETAK